MTPSEAVHPLTLGVGELLEAQAVKRSQQPVGRWFESTPSHEKLS